MTLAPEEVEEIKDQLREQVNHLPEDKKAQALAQIDSLSTEAVETLVKQQQARNANPNQKEKTIFRMIVDKDVPAVSVSEDSFSLAVLDINPISKGHVIIIPKTSVSNPKDIPKNSIALAKKLAKRTISKLKATSNEIQPETKFGESIVNLIPCYGSKLSLASPRTKASTEELEKIAILIKDKPIKPKIEKIKIEKRKSSESQVLKLKRRIP